MSCEIIQVMQVGDTRVCYSDGVVMDKLLAVHANYEAYSTANCLRC